MKNLKVVKNETNNVYPLTSEEFTQPEKITSQVVLDVINEDDLEVE
tara:strand:- start:829 stop:966 length:138 start_codon:yes stop_codon:yes gene_type:complete